ncbi:MAG: D-glycerate dehydrogenase, partial [Candidatus Eremiobacteraeota bacterium]|nr:D-glycerate dehydrogenase [Candidatus Eremiobacteraeota bacterium]MBV8355188.1 D-glycerate dehydrogenase [Candidatus Eremiobacteraeota bacterium]
MKVLSLWPLTENARRRLEEAANVVEDASDRPLSREELAQRLSDVDGLICFPLTAKLDGALIASAPRLRVIATVAVGYDNIDLRVCAERGIAVGNTPGVVANATADIGMALILATMRRIVSGVDFIRAGRWERGEMHSYGNDLATKTLGIFGMGAIGSALARRAYAAEMTVIYHNRNPRPDKTDARYVSFEELLRESDVVAVTSPLTPQTRGVFGAEAFAKMKRGAYFVNIARGGVVQTDALYEALRSGHLAYAGLDVTDPEPLPLSHPLFTLPNVVVIPHMGTSTPETR